MVLNPSTPGVYLRQERPLFPQPQLELALPVVMGYTEKGGDLPLTLVGSLNEYEELFGGSDKRLQVSVDLSKSTPEKQFTAINANKYALRHLMYYGMRLYFDNGGGPCYILSVGNYPADDANQMEGALLIQTGGALDKLAEFQDPCLLLLADLGNISDAGQANVLTAALKHCADAGNRFCLLDLKDATTEAEIATVVSDFRTNIGIDHLQYGSAFYPWVVTDQLLQAGATDEDIVILSDETGHEYERLSVAEGDYVSAELAQYIRDQILAEGINTTNMVLPPGFAALARQNAADRAQGPWQPAANSAIASARQLQVSLPQATLDDFNLPVDGKAINNIKSIPGRGPVLWGARTFDGNSNEWRYMTVRRTFSAIEYALKRNLEYLVFEANNANTWAAARSRADGLLDRLWRQGAMAGETPEEAFYVNVGLGESMTPQDILEGRLIIDVGMAIARPMEFVLVRIAFQVVES